MDATTNTQSLSPDFESRHLYLRDLLAEQSGDVDLPELIDPPKQPSVWERWLNDLMERFGDWLGTWESNKRTQGSLFESVDWHSTIVILLVGLALVMVVAIVRQVFIKRKAAHRLHSKDHLDALPTRETPSEYLQNLLAAHRYPEAMLLRWRLFQIQQGLQSHTTPLEFCYRVGVADREPVNAAYRYMFGHVRAERAHYEAFDQWLNQAQGGVG